MLQEIHSIFIEALIILDNNRTTQEGMPRTSNDSTNYWPHVRVILLAMSHMIYSVFAITQSREVSEKKAHNFTYTDRQHRSNLEKSKSVRSCNREFLLGHLRMAKLLSNKLSKGAHSIRTASSNNKLGVGGKRERGGGGERVVVWERERETEKERDYNHVHAIIIVMHQTKQRLVTIESLVLLSVTAFNIETAVKHKRQQAES